MSGALIEKSHWYWNRLTCMSQPELMHRVQSTLMTQLQKSGFLLDKTTPDADTHQPSLDWINQPSTVKSDYCKAADQLLSGHLTVFECNNLFIGHPPTWNQNPRSDHRSPLVFGKTLDYRNENIVGDIKYLWEPSRHLQLVTIAQAYYVSKDEKYLDALDVQLTSWFKQCPYMLGAQWTSSLELGIRLINWSFVWQMIGGLHSRLFSGCAGQQLLRRWLSSIYQHIRFINGHYSRFSSANNHLIGEASGVFVATLTWPFWKDNEPLMIHAKDIIESEVSEQISSDGVDREQTTSYQQFVLQFLMVCGIAGQKNNHDFSIEYWGSIEKMLEFVAAVMDKDGHVPMIGDADDGYVVKLSQEENWNPYRSLLALGAQLFDRSDFGDLAGQVDDQCRWLFNENMPSIPRRLDAKANTIPTSFPEGGYYIMGNHLNKAEETKVIIDCGPLGYQGIAAHGHADALALTLNYGGIEFLVDPGTYAYHTKKTWRDYFRGTSAHNTVRVDGLDQSVSGGNFMWTHKAEATCNTWMTSPQLDLFKGEHNGYKRLKDPVIHTRTVSFDKILNCIEVVDRLICKKEHKIEGFWHLAERCKVVNSESGYRVTHQTHQLNITFSGNKVITSLHNGEEVPPLGWISRQYGKKGSTNTIRWALDITGDTSITTRIELSSQTASTLTS